MTPEHQWSIEGQHWLETLSNDQKDALKAFFRGTPDEVLHARGYVGFRLCFAKRRCKDISLVSPNRRFGPGKTGKVHLAT